MRHWLRTILTSFALLLVLAARSAAVSVEDLVNLKANGLSDEVLVALIEADGSVFRLSPAEVVSLYRRGLGDKVLLAMIATSQGTAIPRAAGLRAESAVVQEPARPVEVHVHQSVVQEVAAPAPVSAVVVVPVPVAVWRPAPVVRPAPPVYWGYGGNLRQDAWKPLRELDRRPVPDSARPDAR